MFHAALSYTTRQQVGKGFPPAFVDVVTTNPTNGQAMLADMAKPHVGRLKLQATRLRELRNNKRLSLMDLERQLKGQLKKPALANYETARRALGPEEAQILGTYFGVPSSYLLAVDEEMEPLTKQERQLIKDFRELPGRERAMYGRRIAALAAVYRDAIDDETAEQHRQAARTSPSE